MLIKGFWNTFMFFEIILALFPSYSRAQNQKNGKGKKSKKRKMSESEDLPQKKKSKQNV